MPVKILDRIDKSAKKITTPPRRLSIVDGIDVELKAEKSHKMGTREDKQQRQAPLHLRSRSVPRLQQNRSDVTHSKSKPNIKSRERARSVSAKDRSGPSSVDNEPDGCAILSDALNRIQIDNPLRFKKFFPNKQSTAIGTVYGTAGNVWKPVSSVDRKIPTVPQSFNLTQVQKKEVTPSQPSEFKNGAAHTKTPTSRRKTLCVIEFEQTGERVLRDRNVVTGVGLVPKRELTQPKPFSFDKREKKIEGEIRGGSQSQANHLSASAAPRERSPSPFSRKPVVPVGNGIAGNHADKKTKVATIPPVKAPLVPAFRARVPVVLAKKPFQPVKPQRQLALPSFSLATEERAKKRQEYEKKQFEKEEEIQTIRKRQREEQERREEQETLKLRKELVHKAKPIPHYKHFKPQPSDKLLTDPESPLCLKRSVKTSR